jgi:hypothetical protein
MAFSSSRALFALGQVLFEQGDVARADALYREGLAIRQETLFLVYVASGLEGLAMVAATTGQPARAARLWGAAEALREATDEGRWHVFQRSYERALATARTRLSEAQWAIAWAAGRALTAEQAVAEALADVGKTLIR